MTASLSSPVGFVELDRVWLDDRARCTWALCDLSLVVEPGRTAALVGVADDEAAPGAVLDLLSGRRAPVRGRVGLDGVDLDDLDRIDHLRALAAQVDVLGGERRLVVAGRTTIVARPAPLTLAAADLVVVFEHGFEVARGTHRGLLATSERYGRLVRARERATAA